MLIIKKRFLYLWVLANILGLLLVSCEILKEPDTISGVVLSEHGPVVDAVVRVQTTEIYTTTNTDGKFTLSELAQDETAFITAWASGYYIVGVKSTLGEDEVEIHLHAHTKEDNPDYEWLPSTFHPGQDENQGCAECHSGTNTDLPFSLPVDEWLLDAHSQSAQNPRFITMYLGTDVNGNQSPFTRFGTNRDYGRFPLRPDPNQPYYGPGYKLDFSETAGNCAACHTPASAANDPYNIDPTKVSGVGAEGVPCDFCHKVWDTRLDPASGLPYPNMPGVLSFEFRRPPDGHQFFAGPFDDVAPGEDTYSPLQEQSQFCAACHFGVFWDTVVYNSFGEWLESPYNDPDTGQTCQDCHMPRLGNSHFALPEADGQERDPATIFSHCMPGASDEGLLKNAVNMDVEAEKQGDRIQVRVSITNDQTGHHVPTDSPLRHMILRVQAFGSDGETLTQIDGSTIPDWGGVGDPSEGYYAGLPGKGYAKILMELWTEVSPTGAYWNPTRVVYDNRIAAFELDRSKYTFALSDEGETTVTVILLYRRAFIELMDQKGWNVPDIVMERETITIP